MTASDDNVLESLGAGICTMCGRGGYLLARIPVALERSSIVTVTPSPEISWCDVIVERLGEELHEIWGHTAD